MNTDQMLGLMTGILFGFLLQKGRVLRFEKQVGAMLLKDMTIVKFMLSAILVGMVGIVILKDAGIITLSHKPMNLGAVLLGGALFGTGWAVMGYCPGTSIGALGEGRWHALFAVAGMVAGAGRPLRGTLSLHEIDGSRVERLRQDRVAGSPWSLIMGHNSFILGRNDLLVLLV